MMVPMKDILVKAKKENYGVAAPNVFNKESVQAVFEAAHELHAPVIVALHRIMDIETTAHIVRFYEKKYPDVVFALNLDHGESFDEIILGLRNGTSAVMCDRSVLPFEENIKEVQEIVKIAHAVGVSVEAELGHVGQGYEYESTRESGLTRPDEAKEYVERTGVDCLAVSVGTSHGVYKGEPHLEFELLKTLSKEVDVPLVLHGGSGTGDDNLAKAVKCGIQKVNLFTDLNVAASNAMHEAYEKDPSLGLLQLGEFAKNGYKEKLMHYMKLFDSEGRA